MWFCSNVTDSHISRVESMPRGRTTQNVSPALKLKLNEKATAKGNNLDWRQHINPSALRLFTLKQSEGGFFVQSLSLFNMNIKIRFYMKASESNITSIETNLNRSIELKLEDYDISFFIILV